MQATLRAVRSPLVALKEAVTDIPLRDVLYAQFYPLGEHLRNHAISMFLSVKPPSHTGIPAYIQASRQLNRERLREA